MKMEMHAPQTSQALYREKWGNVSKNFNEKAYVVQPKAYYNDIWLFNKQLYVYLMKESYGLGMYLCQTL